jgi:hypothetical protein
MVGQSVNKLFVKSLLALGLLLCLQLQAQQAGDDLLAQLIAANRGGEALGPWAGQPERYKLQVLYTQIDRDADNLPSFRTYRWGVGGQEYFYPASTVKMAAAFAALEKINRLGLAGFDKNTPVRWGAGHAPQTAFTADSSAADGRPSIAHLIRKIFIVSDNDAHNRLYEFLGQRAFNDLLQEKGLDQCRLLHRLAAPGFDSLSNRYTNSFEAYRGDSILYQQEEVYSSYRGSVRVENQRLGVGYIDANEQLISQPFDFSERNYISLSNLHDMLLRVVFPEAWSPAERFDLSADDYRFLYRAMSELPRESDYPNYSDKPDNYVKFWMFGDRDSTYEIPRHIRVFNKVGWAYGFLTDVAYVVDFEAGIEFVMAATILVNENGIFNDGQYEYETIGLPFFGQLGRLVYEYERQRPREFRPRLTKFSELR